MEFSMGSHNLGKFQQGIDLASLVALALLMLGVFCTLKMIFRQEEKNYQYYGASLTIDNANIYLKINKVNKVEQAYY
mgnify:CR=1 FL=1